MEALNNDDISHKGKKIQKYSLDLKKQDIAFAEEHGNRPASRHFKVDGRRIREWRSQKSEIVQLIASKKGKQRIKLSGGGRKPLSLKLEETLIQWIDSRRAISVSCKLIMKKAEITYRSIKAGNNEDFEEFKASSGRLTSFVKRNGLSPRRKTSVAQQDPERLVAKLVAYIVQVRRMQKKHNYNPSDIIAMDETPIWCYIISGTTIDKTGKKSITLKTTGNEKAGVSVHVELAKPMEPS